MSKVLFKVIRWKNLLSTGNTFTEVTFDSHATTLIIGTNGVGKSSILDAISFVLYGKPFRKINKGQLVNSINNKNLVVEIEFEIGKRKYKIIRGIKPNIFEIILDGNLINQDASLRDYQEQLEKNILKMNHKSFSQVVVLGTSTYIPFMELTTANRRSVIEDLLDIEIFTVMNSLLKDKIYYMKDTRRKLDTELKQIVLNIRLSAKHIKDIESINTNRTSDIQDKIAASAIAIGKHRTDIAKLSENIDHLSVQLEIKDSVMSKSNQFKTIKTQLNTKKKRLSKEVSFYNQHDDCPECGQNIDDAFKDNILESHMTIIDETEAAIGQVGTRLEDIQTKIQELSAIQKEMSSLNAHLISDTSEIRNHEKNITTLKNELEDNAKQDIASEKAELADLKTKQHSLETQLSAHATDMNTTKHASFLLKDGGIKTRIIKQYIPIMNKLINQYLAALDFYCQFDLDENFNETIKSRHRDDFSYHSFSEGEKMRINISLLFAWRAIAKLRNSVSTNLLLMDEVLDASLDQQGTEDFLNILHRLIADTNVFIISHKTDHIISKFDRVLKVTKHKNFSSIEDELVDS